MTQTGETVELRKKHSSTTTAFKDDKLERYLKIQLVPRSKHPHSQL